MNRRVYLDNAATTGMKQEVLDEMIPFFTERYANASSIHTSGRDARKAVDHAREQVAGAIGADPAEIYFTSGGTESDNWAVKGVAAANEKKGKHIITSSIEHHAILHACAALEKQGYEVTYLPVDEFGRVSPQSVADAIRPDTVLVSIMMANNEVGTIEPIAEIGAVCREKGVTFHTDAVQAVGNIPIDVKAMNVDLLTLTAHKIYGPKGEGALYVRKGVRIATFMDGGAQEKGKRSGTYNTPGIVGLGKSIEMATADIEGHSRKIRELQHRLRDGLLEKIPYSQVNGHLEDRLAGNLNMSFGYIEGEGMLLHMDLLGIDVSSGSACTSGSLEASHVLTAMCVVPEWAQGSVRFTIGDFNTREDIDYVLEKLPPIVEKLRQMSPLYEEVRKNV